MKRTHAILWITAATLAALGVFQVKFQVQDMEKQLARVEQDIVNHQEAIHVLEAEWSYLTRPSRIERLAREHLMMEPLPPEQMASFDDLPWRGDSTPAAPFPQEAPGGGLPEIVPGAPTAEMKPFLASAETRQ